MFVLKTKAHEKFIRDDKDLITTSEIPLKDAVEGFTTTITTLDGRRLRVSEPFLSHSHCQTVLTGEGMPSQRAGGEPGDLIIKYVNIEVAVAAMAATEKLNLSHLETDLLITLSLLQV